MPQGRRKTPFSGKAKKEQLKAKKQSKAFGQGQGLAFLQNIEHGEASNVQKLNFQTSKTSKVKSNRYALQFFKESDEEIRQRKEAARGTLVPCDETQLEVNGGDYFPDDLDFPKRPEWSFDLSKSQLEAKENKYFSEYLASIESKYDWKDLSFFELNLETWRQLWRVLEMSDIVLFIVDIRYPALMFPPSLYKYVTETLKKDLILVLNKVDLCPAPLVAAWKNYFETKYPQLNIVMFTTTPGYNLVGKTEDKSGLLVRKRKGRIRMALEGTQELLNKCKALVGNEVDLSSWQQKIVEETEAGIDDDDKVEIGETVIVDPESHYYQHQKFHGGVLTIGCIGQPNVGKSSLMNAIMGKKVVSVSKTPGHTKHFQTIFLTKTVKLCDCPGLVFPSKVPKPLQVLMGSFPIAQLREPFSTVQYLGERLDLVKLLKIDHHEGDDTWSAMDICDSWAKKRGFLTAKAARLDSYRAANSLLRMALDGKICLCLRPPQYSKKEAFWAQHEDVQKVKWIQAVSNPDQENEAKEAEFSESDSDPEEKEIESSESELEGNLINKFALLDQSND